MIAGVCLVLGIKLFFEVFIKKTKKVNWYFIGALSIMTIYFLARANFDNISLVLSLMIGVVLIFVVYNYKDDMSFKEITLIFTFGVLTSIIIGFVCFGNSRLVSLIGETWAFSRIRFQGVAGNVNVFACEMMLSLIALMLLNLRDNVNLLIYPVFIIQLISLLFALSKSAILMFLLGTFLYIILKIIYSAKTKKMLTKALKTIIAFALISCSVFLIFNYQYQLCKLRFDFAIVRVEIPNLNNNTNNNSNNTTNNNPNYKTEIDYSELTTGRTDIWKGYLKEITKSSQSALFGFGVGHEFYGDWDYYSGTSSHNTVIQAFYYIGIVGFVLMLLVLLTILDLKKFSLKNFNLEGIILLLVTGIFLMGADFFSFRLGVYLTIILFAFRNEEQNEDLLVTSDESMQRIPKVIHYIWLGGKPLPKLAEKCINTWKQQCPDYEIKRWDESNLDISINKYCSIAYEAKKYAFSSDVLRYYILKQEGGIYLDIDVKLLKPLDKFLSHEAFSGFEDGRELMVAPGLILGSEKNGKLVTRMLDHYNNVEVESIEDIISKETVCTKITQVLKDEFELKEENITQNLKDVTIYATEFFCPYNTVTNQKKITVNSYAIHLYLSSWYSYKKKIMSCVKKFLNYTTNGWFGILYAKLN
ncbi:MAG: O-antigen ligase family protein [Bacilli bacterium]|nr:O-antigen ligase family protein [Bacilli bacterium]